MAFIKNYPRQAYKELAKSNTFFNYQHMAETTGNLKIEVTA
jgi:hypothetical protein